MISKEPNNMTWLKHILKYRSFMALIIAFLMILPVIIPTLTVMVKAADIIVDPDGSGDYFTIQEAINNANPGDTIWVKQGSYTGPIIINVNELNLIADNGAEPILYLTSDSPGIDVISNTVLIKGFRIYGNSAIGGGPTIRLQSTAYQTRIRNNDFRAISGETGNTALLIESGTINTEFTGNTVRNHHQGVSLQSSTNCAISGNTFINVDHQIHHAATIQGTSIWYGTIQDAIDNAITGNTVSVLSGEFNENIVINDSLVFKGAQSEVNPTNGRSGDETILNGNTVSAIRITPETKDVTIDGFTVQVPNKSPASNEAGVMIQPGTKNIQIKNTIFENITDGPGVDTIADETYAIMVYGRDEVIGGQKDISILNNLIRNVEEYGIAINDNTSHVTISGNVIKNLIASDHAADPFWDPSWPEIICSAIHLGGQVGPITNITITNNILISETMGDGVITAAGSGISFAGVDEWMPPNRPWQGFNDIYISKNKITNNSMGLVALVGETIGEITVHGQTNVNDGNNLSNNTQFAVNNMAGNGTVVNATNNWWGDLMGPSGEGTGFGSAVSENVTFWPWFEFGTEKGGFSTPPIVEYNVGLPNVDEEIITESTEITINAADEESGLLSLTYRTWNTTHRWGPWINYTSPFKLLGQGEHRVQYNATDNAGTSLYTDGMTFFSEFTYHEHRVDTVSPLATVIYPNGGEFEFGIIPIEWMAVDQIFDQGQLTWNNSISLTEDYPGHIQSFIPTQDTIDSLQLLLFGDDATISVRIFDSIYPVPNVIGQSIKKVENVGFVDNPEWIDFPFNSTITIDTEETYYVGVTQQVHSGIGFRWYYFDDLDPFNDKYPYGNAWVKQVDALVEEPTMDFGFKTKYWDTNLDITIQFSMTGVPPWSTIAENNPNTGLYQWNTATYGIPDGPNYLIRIVAEDEMGNIGFDSSDSTFIINNDGLGVYNVEITDTTISDSSFTKNGNNLQISATIVGDPVTITADLSSFGKGTEVEYTSFTGGVAQWVVTNILCVPSDGPVTVTITATDATDDTAVGSASIIADNTPPEISISKPRPGFYFMDSTRLLPFSYPFIIGQITFEASVSDDGSGVKSVEFYLENTLEATVTEPPYRWTWNQQATGFWDIEIVVTDQVGHEAFDEIKDLFIINLGIFT